MLKTRLSWHWIRTTWWKLCSNSAHRKRKSWFSNRSRVRRPRRKPISRARNRRLSARKRNKNCSGRDWQRFWLLRSCQCGKRLTRLSDNTTKPWSHAKISLNRPVYWTSRMRSWKHFWISTCRQGSIRNCRCRPPKLFAWISDCDWRLKRFKFAAFFIIIKF